MVNGEVCDDAELIADPNGVDRFDDDTRVDGDRWRLNRFAHRSGLRVCYADLTSLTLPLCLTLRLEVQHGRSSGGFGNTRTRSDCAVD
jgi:hypothetical protein